jgi:hypothetical protein
VKWSFCKQIKKLTVAKRFDATGELVCDSDDDDDSEMDSVGLLGHVEHFRGFTLE